MALGFDVRREINLVSGGLKRDVSQGFYYRDAAGHVTFSRLNSTNRCFPSQVKTLLPTTQSCFGLFWGRGTYDPSTVRTPPTFFHASVSGVLKHAP